MYLWPVLCSKYSVFITIIAQVLLTETNKCPQHPQYSSQTNIFIHVMCVIEISEDDDSEEDLEHTKHVGDQNGGQPPQAKKLRT